MKALGFCRTLKNALASDCDEMGVQFNIGSRTLLAATRRLNDGLPSEKKNVWWLRKKCKTFDTDSFPLYGDQTKTVTTRSTQLHLYSRFNVTLDPFLYKIKWRQCLSHFNLPNSGGGGGGGISKPVKDKKHQHKSETSTATNYTCQSQLQ